MPVSELTPLTIRELSNMPENDNNNAIPNALPVGYRFNEFEIKEVIGGGGFGIVYRAWDHQLERTVAIKEYMPSSLAVRGEDNRLVLRGERFRKTFQAGLNSFIQEARMLARFSHTGLLHVLRFWVQNDTAYMCTQFYDGTTLKKLQLRQPQLINEAWILKMLPPLFGAMRTIHQAGYLHRDISLDNIQIQENMLPVLLDFGSARKEIGNLSDAMEIMLKPGFAPIEQYSEDSDAEQGPWTDIYALGAVLHTLIVGFPPPVSVVRSLDDSYQPLELRRPAGYSLSLLRAIDHALALKPEARPQTIDELAALVALPVGERDVVVSQSSQQQNTMMVPVTAPEVVKSKQPDRPMLIPVLIGCGVLVGAIVGVLIGMFHGGGSNSPVVANNSASDNSLANNSAPQAVSAPVVSSQPVVQAAPVVPATPIAQVYLKIKLDEVLKVNDKEQSLTPTANGFTLVQLPAGSYQFKISGHGQDRTQRVTIDRAGTWLLNF